jgi:FkbM family methyltransferase
MSPGKIKSYLRSALNKDKKETSKIELYTSSYAQEGEDLVLSRFFDGKDKGYFVDIGAHHPKRFSNTYLFYLKGWRGINIDPLPGVKEVFEKVRPEDNNLELGISQEQQKITYHMFNEPALNTFSPEEASKKDGIHDGVFFIEEKRLIQTYPLKDILTKHVPDNQVIDFFSIDVEGLDLEVLKSNDWESFRPTIIAIEECNLSIKELINDSLIHKFMENENYELVSRTVNTSFYKKHGD